MMEPSISTYIWPGQVHFGFGAVDRVAEEAKAYCGTNVFLITDPGVAATGLVESVTAPLKAADLPFEIYDQVVPNPDTDLVDEAVEAFRASGANLIIGLGGGSGLDTAKAVLLVTGGRVYCGILAVSGRCAAPDTIIQKHAAFNCNSHNSRYR